MPSRRSNDDARSLRHRRAHGRRRPRWSRRRRDGAACCENAHPTATARSVGRSRSHSPRPQAGSRSRSLRCRSTARCSSASWQHLATSSRRRLAPELTRVTNCRNAARAPAGMAGARRGGRRCRSTRRRHRRDLAVVGQRDPGDCVAAHRPLHRQHRRRHTHGGVHARRARRRLLGKRAPRPGSRRGLRDLDVRGRRARLRRMRRAHRRGGRSSGRGRHRHHRVDGGDRPNRRTARRSRPDRRSFPRISPRSSDRTIGRGSTSPIGGTPALHRLSPTFTTPCPGL